MESSPCLREYESHLRPKKTYSNLDLRRSIVDLRGPIADLAEKNREAEGVDPSSKIPSRRDALPVDLCVFRLGIGVSIRYLCT